MLLISNWIQINGLNNFEIHVYYFAKEQIVTVYVPPTNKDLAFGFEFATDDLYYHMSMSVM